VTSPRATFIYGRIRIAPDGVFVHERKVAERGDVVERLARDGVVEVRAPHTSTNVAAGILGGVGGFFAGAMIGAAVQPRCSCDDPGVAGAIFGAPIGAIAGAVALARASTSPMEVIFRSDLAGQTPDSAARTADKAGFEQPEDDDDDGKNEEQFRQAE
jgi:hypothetical protein